MAIKHNLIDTIVAQATPPGRGGIAIIRVSGPLVKSIMQRMLGREISAREAVWSSFCDEQQQALDEGIAVYFPNPHSFTGEDVLELHGHGGPVLVDTLLKHVTSLGARLARPGEFSERAFLNGKMDLAQAEAVADLIDASSEQAARLALRSLQGDFSRAIHVLNERLTHLRIYVEAAIDFSDEEIDFMTDDKLKQLYASVMDRLVAIQSNAKQGSLLREGITAVIAGAPNVGKSSLLNALSGKDTAIVTDVPGTTRDVLRDVILIDGMPMHIIDTAGLRESDDIVEQEGMRRARDEMAKADVVLHVVSAEQSLDCVAASSHLIIRNKIDKTNEPASIRQENGQTIISLSAKTGLGLDLLKQHIKSLAGMQQQEEGLFLARRRHLDALNRTHAYLTHGFHQLTHSPSPELAAEDLRLAQNALGEITGEFTADDLLGKIFSSFCIGK